MRRRSLCDRSRALVCVCGGGRQAATAAALAAWELWRSGAASSGGGSDAASSRGPPTPRSRARPSPAAATWRGRGWAIGRQLRRPCGEPSGRVCSVWVLFRAVTPRGGAARLWWSLRACGDDSIADDGYSLQFESVILTRIRVSCVCTPTLVDQTYSTVQRDAGAALWPLGSLQQSSGRSRRYEMTFT